MNRTVAVSQRVDIWDTRNERRDAVDQRLCHWLWSVGCVPVPVPNALHSLTGDDGTGSALHSWLLAIQPDAVVLSGGNDIGTVPERDHTENALLTYALDRTLPVLGLCRGMQQMAVWSGGELIPVAGHVRTCHRLQRGDDRGIWPDTVNSFHEMALNGCPVGYDAATWAEDGVIESICHKRLPWEGWMWHPERDVVADTCNRARWRALLDRGQP